MVDYNAMKVPDLKKLLGERSLPISGNKADLIARLQEDDTKKSGSAGMFSPSLLKPAHSSRGIDLSLSPSLRAFLTHS
jgi:SAP domain-containing ribonucleoprotein